MATVEQLTIEFKGTGSTILRNQLDSLGKSMNNLAKSYVRGTAPIKKANAEQTKLNATTLKLTSSLVAQGSSWAKLGVSSKVVSMAFRGNQVAIEKLRIAYKKMTLTTRILGGSFAVARSKLLIYSFAAGLVSKLVLDQVKAFAKQEASVARLAHVFGSEGAKSLNKYSSELQKVTTFGDEDINMMMAQVGAFGASEEQTKKLAKATLDLSAGMGIGLNDAGKLVAKSIGSSTNALGRYGVELEAGANKTEKVDQIIKGLDTTYGGLAEQLAQTTEGQLEQAKNAFGDFGETIGEMLTPAVLAVAKALKFIAEILSNKIFQATVVFLTSAAAASWAYATATAAITAGTISLTAATGLLTGAMHSLKGAIASTGIGALAVAIGFVVGAAITWFSVIKDNNEEQEKENELLKLKAEYLTEEKERRDALNAEIDKSISNLGQTLALLDAEIQKGSELTELEKAQITSKHRLTEEEIKFYEAIDDSNRILEERRQEQKDIIEAEKKIAKEQERIRKEREKAEKKAIKIEEKKQQAVRKSQQSLKRESKLIALKVKLGRDLTTAEQLSFDLKRKLTPQEEAYVKSIDLGNQKIQERIDKEQERIDKEAEAEAGRKAVREKSIEFAGAMFSSFEASSNAQMQAVQKQQQFELDQLRNSRQYQKASDKDKKKQEEDILKRNKKHMQKAFNDNKNARYAQVIIDTYAAVTAALADITAPFNIAVATMIGTMGAQQLAGIKATKAPKFAYGGLVGGQPHSQGGTMIEAERGEFVVRKAAVDALGLESLNRINAGGGGGSVNISFGGNVLSKDFIEDEAIPQIKEAIRRGADIGVG